MTRAPDRPAQPTSGSATSAEESGFSPSERHGVLIVVGGLPGVGKSTVAEAFARRARIAYLRVDRIEQAVVDQTTLTHPVGPVGYAVAHQLAAEQLALGLDVVVECVNPLDLTREGWRGTATAAGAGLVEVEIVCSDPAEHRRRVEDRDTDVVGLVKPTWIDVEQRAYEPWPEPHLVLDSCSMTVEAMVAAVESRRAQQSSPCLP